MNILLNPGKDAGLKGSPFQIIYSSVKKPCAKESRQKSNYRLLCNQLL